MKVVETSFNMCLLQLSLFPMTGILEKCDVILLSMVETVRKRSRNYDYLSYYVSLTS